jgi:hypothetical protein
MLNMLHESVDFVHSGVENFVQSVVNRTGYYEYKNDSTSSDLYDARFLPLASPASRAKSTMRKVIIDRALKHAQPSILSRRLGIRRPKDWLRLAHQGSAMAVKQAKLKR